MWGNICLEGHKVPNFAHTAPDVGDKSKCKKLNVVAEKVWSSHPLKTESKFPQVLPRKWANTRFRIAQINTCYFSCSLFFFDSNSFMNVVLSKRGNSSLAQHQNDILILHLILGKNRIHSWGGMGVAWLASLEWLCLSSPILLWKRWCCSLNMYKLQSCRAPLCFKIICNTFFSRFGKKDHHISGGSSFDELEGGGLTLACEIFNGEEKLAYATKEIGRIKPFLV